MIGLFFWGKCEIAENLKEEEQSKLINEAVDSFENSSSIKEENSTNQEELKKFITNYLEAMFNYGSNAERNKTVRPFVSDKC